MDDIVSRMLDKAEDSYPQLRKLDTGSPHYLSCSGSRDRATPLRYPVVPPSHVQDLCLRGSRSEDWTQGFASPISGLKRLHFLYHDTLTRPKLLDVLVNLPSLETLIIEDCSTHWTPGPVVYGPNNPIPNHDLIPAPRFTHPNLMTFECLRLDELSTKQLLESLITPNLTCLKVWWFSGWKGQINQGEPLVTMLRGCPQLQTLGLCCFETEDSWWKEVFNTATCVKHLRLRNNEFLEEDLESLCESGLVMPYLERLALENVFGIKTDVVRRIVVDRPDLQYVELRGWDATRVAKEDVEFLRSSVRDFVLETFGGTEQAISNEDESDWSSSGTPSEGSWLSGDQYVVDLALSGIRTFDIIGF
ncbi:hypothetical protein FRB90_011642 [Tulasnella sp. 427]|nr:hypothetical protein FRB90_011642 [Tulasnella sp. 427]